jgi:hypothetical protein
MVIYMNSNISVTSLVCNMDVFTPSERENHIQSTTRLYQSAQDIHEVQNGYGFIFPNETAIITKLGEFISNERRCCPFLEFTLKITSNNAPISLFLTGPEGAQEFLRAEFTEYRASGSEAFL